ncbi:hypothetical protein SK128_026812 [Halocaridina rubra]|uniref:Uncharacterized protein n=1 Tax=Halocaridina rubra TaxID=373956 RepID=A0AAN9AH24_HALRR
MVLVESAVRMGGRLVCVIVSLGVAMVLAMLPLGAEGGVALSAKNPHPRQDQPAEDFSGGFSEDFAQDLPTREFMVDFQSRVKRQVGITSALDSILSTPYKLGLETNHLQALLTRNSLARPERELTPGLRSSSQATQQGSLTKPSPTVRLRIPLRPNSEIPNPPSRARQPHPSQERQNTGTQFQPNFGSMISFNERPSSGHQFPSTSFAGQQFSTPFPSFNRRFPGSSRGTRQKREATGRQDISSQISSIIASPYRGSIPSSITSLFTRNNRYPRKSQSKPEPATVMLDETNEQKSQVSKPLENPFKFPFNIPNFFQNLGIRRRSLNIAEDRQGISDVLDDIIYSPYEGHRPSSIHSLFRNNRNRFVRKTQPSAQPDPNSFRQPQGSDDPFEAAVRLTPNYYTGFEVDLPSGHMAFGSLPNRKKRSTNLRRKNFTHRPHRLLPNRQRRKTHERLPRLPYVSSSRYRVRIFPHDSQQLGKKASLRQEKDAEVVYGDEENNSPNFAGTDIIEPFDFLTNFNTPFESKFEDGSPRDYVDISTGKDEVEDIFASKELKRPHRLSPYNRFARPRPNTAPGFRPGPSPPARILPPSSTVRAPRHIIIKNRRLPKSTRQQDIPIIRRSLDVAESKKHLQLILPPDVAAAKEESNGFMDGVRNRMPSFETIGGFAPMGAVEKGDESSSFVPAFQMPVVNIPDISEKQPQFKLAEFPGQLFQ